MDEKNKKFTSRNSRINLSHTLESNKTKATNQHTSLINILQQKYNILHHIWHTISKSGKIDGETKSKKFWESDVIENKPEHGQLTSERTKRTRTKNVTWMSDEKNSENSIIFSLGQRLWILSQLCCVYWVSLIWQNFCLKIIILTNLSKFYAFVSIFSKFWSIFSANSRLRNGNPVNWRDLSQNIRFINIRY